MTNLADIPFSIQHTPGFEEAAQVFRDSFVRPDDEETIQELGAQFSVYRYGEPIINFMGGWADRKKTKAVNARTLMALSLIHI